MNDPKAVSGHLSPDTQKQDGAFGKGAEIAPGQPLGAQVTNQPVQPVAPAQAATDIDENADPMARLTAIVSQSTGQAAQPMPVQAQPVMPVQPVSVAPVPTAIPDFEIVAEDRSAVLQAPVSVKEKGTSFFGRKKAEMVSETATIADQLPADVLATPEKRGFWARRKNQSVQSIPVDRTPRDKRWARRRRRVWLEELLGWVFVPLILIGIYYAVLGVFALVGTTPEAVISGIKMILGHF